MKIPLHPLVYFFIVVLVSSCESRWSSKNKQQLKESCLSIQEILYPEDASMICDCYIEKLVKDFPKADMSDAQASEILLDCANGAKEKMRIDNERKLQEMLDSMESESDSTDLR